MVEGLKILLVEDSPGDQSMVMDYLREAFTDVTISTALTLHEATAILKADPEIDTVLLDLHLSDGSGKDLIASIRSSLTNGSIIILTGNTDREFALESISMGASDFILKSEMSPLLLYKSITYNMERKKFNAALANSEKKYFDLFQFSPLPMYVYDVNSLQFLDVNESAIAQYGYSRNEFLELTIKDIRPKEDVPTLLEAIHRLKKSGASKSSGIYRHKKKNGSIIDVEIRGNLIQFNGRTAELILVTDITEDIKNEKLIIRQSKLLEAVTSFNTELLKSPDWQQALTNAFSKIGSAIGVDRVYYFENHLDPETGKWLTSHKLEWTDEGIESFRGNEILLNVKINEHPDFFEPLMKSGQTQYIVSEMPIGPTREIIELQNIKSFVVRAIYVNQHFQGFIGFDDCRNERQWQKDEIGFLETLAANMAVTIEKQLAVTQLQASEEKFKALVQEGSDLIVILDAHGRCTYVSPSVDVLLGLKNQEMLGKPIIRRIHEADHDWITQLFFELPEHQSLEVVPFRFLNADGQWRWLETTLTNLLDDPAVLGIVANSRDVTDKIQKNQALQESLERYDIVAKATSDIIWDLDLESDIMRYNTSINKVFGYQENEVRNVREWWEKNIHPDDIEGVRNVLEAALQKGTERFQIKYRFKDQKGNYRHIYDRAFVIKDPSGESTRIIGAMQDITKAKAERERIILQESVITNASDSIMITDAELNEGHESKIIFVNEAFCKMTGYQSTELIGKSPKILQGPGTSESQLEIMRQAVDTGRACEVEVINYRKDGTPFWVHISLSPVWSDNKIRHWIAIERDITVERNYVQKLEAYNARLEDIAWMQSHLVRAPLSNLMGLIELLRTCEKSEREEIETMLLKSSEQLDQVIRSIVKSADRLENEQSNNGPPRYNIVDGQLHDLHLHPELMEKASHAYSISNRSDQLLYVNEAFEHLTGYTKSEAIGNTPLDLLKGPLTQPDVIARMYQQEQNKQPYEVEVIYYKKSGEPIWMRIYAQPYISKEGIFGGYLHIRKDITKDKKAEKNVRLSRESLAASNEELKNFTYTITHDLREPVNSLHALISMLKEEKHNLLDEDGKVLVNRSIASVERINKMIKALMEYARTGAIQEPIKCLPFNHIMQEVNTALALLIKNKQAKIEVDGGEHTICVYPTLFSRAVQNLVHNSLKFSGEVSPIIKIHLTEDENLWYFQIEDNGIGIAKSDLNQVFNLFYYKKPDGQEESHGIGLAVVKRIVEQHQGKISVHSEVGKGTNFIFTISKDL